MGKDKKDDDKSRDKGGNSGGRHGQEDNTADADRRRPIPDPAEPNKHDR